MSTADPVESSEVLEKRAQRTRRILFGLLIILTSLPLLPPLSTAISIPDKPIPSSMDFYEQVASVPEGSTVLVETDWTISTRGESGGEFEALMRILMRKHIKAAFLSMDPQAPKVARDDIQTLNDSRGPGEAQYKEWEDYVSLGYYPNPEATLNALSANLRSAFAGKKDLNPQGENTDVFQSPVLQKVKSLSDVPLFILVTPSSTFTVVVQRLSGKVPLVSMVTGVMGPESLNYYNPFQMKGLIVGLRGAYDLEVCMAKGINEPPNNPALAFPGRPPVDAIPGQVYGLGKLYIAPFHAALLLLIVAVIVGNVGMIRARRKTRK